MEEPRYKLDTFEGPLDLLLSLITKNKIDINDIPISLLCDQYMEYIKEAQSLDMELSSEFIVMASTLMLIKSRMLLPRNEDDEEEDPRAALAAAVLEYKRAKEAAVTLRERFGKYGLRMVKDTDEITVDKSYVADQNVMLLTTAYNRVLNTVHVSDSEAIKNFDPILEKRPVSIRSIVHLLSRKITECGKLPLCDYFSESSDKGELVARFLTVLELLKSGLVVLENEEYREDGIIDVMQNVQIKLAEGADTEALTAAVNDIS